MTTHYEDEIEWDWETFEPHRTYPDGDQRGIVEGRRSGPKDFSDWLAIAVFNIVTEEWVVMSETIIHQRTCGNDDL